MRKFKKEVPAAILLVAVILAALALTAAGMADKKSQPQPAQGVLDLKGWDSNADSSLVLNGEWEFFWKRFITDRSPLPDEQPDLMVPVPAVWNSYTLGGQKLPGFGYATYKLKVINAAPGKPLALSMPTCSTAYRLYINNKLAAFNGRAAADPQHHIPEYRPEVIEFTPVNDSFNIILQVSNYNYARGGMWYAVYMGNPQKIMQTRQNITYRDFFLLGSFLLVVLYCLAVYMLRRDKSSLFFALLCLLLAGRTAIYGDRAINLILPRAICFAATVRIDYVILYWIPCVLTLLLHEFYPREISKKALQGILAYTMAVSLITLPAPISFLTRFVYVTEVVDLLVLIYLVYCLVIAMLRKREDTGLILTGLLALLLGGIHDLMFQNDILKGGLSELSPVGFYIMMLLWSYMLAKRYAGALSAREKALLELSASYERERQTELKFLRAQIRPHFIHNALNAIISISRKDSDRSRRLLVEFSHYLRSCFDFGDLEKEIPVERELEFIRSYVALEQARFGERLQVEYDIDEIDFMLPPLILQPLVENAVKHGLLPKSEGGLVRIYIKHKDNYLLLGVKDNGTGFPPEKKAALKSGSTSERGVGLYNINQRLQKLYNTALHIKNLETGGADVSMQIPLKEF